jgi:DNA-binding response OmpR family regulator
MNILIVDDDQELVKLARRWLEREGHVVSHAGTGPLALEMLEADPLPDLVLLDVMLPRVDGFAILRMLRAAERTRRLPVLVMSAYFDRNEDRARAKALGADDYLIKPLMEYHFLGRVAQFAKQDKT